jgi:putative membrane protein
MSTPTVDDPSNASERKGFYVRGWVLAVVAVVVVAAAAVAIGFAVSDGGDGDRRGFGRGGGRPFGDQHGGGGHVLGVLVLLVLIALVVAVVVLFVRHFRAQPRDATTSAEALLAERFARGEIDEGEYLSRRDALRS